MTPGPKPHDAQSLRSDAERNRGRILVAARTVFERDGLAASMASVAREAGVGIATLFRHFGAKEDLIAAVFADRMDAYVAAVDEALDTPDPWAGFTGFIEAICAMQATDRGFADVLTTTFPAAEGLEERRAAAFQGFLELVDRAKDSGQLRADFASQDLVLLLVANAGVVAFAGDIVPDAWRRLVALVIQSFQAPARGPLPAAPADDALYEAMLRAGSASIASRERSSTT
ncbi:TetR/AcrR family transcriptional regulator [Streptomyces sp. NPDC058335]|uniref:TetR/AcrR family transcriptional regulator n=1 Tax=Streptomyces sp. NPDC058335 TaxID=3346451 RepID=UPI00365520BB